MLRWATQVTPSNHCIQMLQNVQNRLQQSKHNKGQKPKYIIQAQSTSSHSKIHSIYLQHLARAITSITITYLALRLSEHWRQCNILYSSYCTCDFPNSCNSQFGWDCSCNQPQSRLLQLHILFELLPALCRGRCCQQLRLTNSGS